jgi:PKD domain
MMLRVMPPDPHDLPSRTRRRRRRPLRGWVACAGGLVALIAFGADGALGAATGVTGVPQGTTSTPTQTTPTPTPTQPAPTVDGPLEVTMSVSPQVVTVGQTVTYTAQVTGAPPGRQVLYHWAFEGGTGVGQQISRTYQTAGDYPVAVTVTVASVAGLSGVADTLTVVVPNTPPAKQSGTPGSTGTGRGSGTGTGHGSGGGSSKSAAARAAKRAAKQTPAQGVANPLAAQTPSAPTGQQVEGFLLTDSGVPVAPPATTAPTAGSTAAGGSGAGPAGVGSAAGVGGGIALTIAIVTLGALDERRRMSLRSA